jgi:hypothetical protein
MAAPPTEIRANARAALAPVLLLNVIDLLALNKLWPAIWRLAKTRRAGTNFYQGELATNPLVLRCADMREADPERCRKKADECRVKADNADSPADKAAWRHLAQDWINLAEWIEHIRRLTR